MIWDDNQGNATRLVIDSSGNVGIAYTTPSSMNGSANNLVVGSGASGDNTGLTLYSNSDASGSIHFADGTSGGDAYRGFIYYTQSSNHMAFGTDATERLRIDSDGDQKLTGGTDLYVDLFADSGSSQGSASFTFRSDGTSTDQQLASIVMQQESGGGSAQKGEMLFQVSDNANPTTAVKIFNNKNVQFATGMTFGGDTSSANLLDDYEEGTWTPQVSDLSNNQATLSTAQGSYTKIGRMVLLNFNVTLSSKGSMTGSYTFLRNLPFTHPTAAYNGTGHIDYFSNFDTAVSKLAFDTSSTTTVMWMTGVVAAGSTSSNYIPASYFGGNESFKGSIIYQTSV